MTEGAEWPNIYESVPKGPFKDNEGIYDQVIEDSLPSKMGVVQTLADFRSRKMKFLWQELQIPMGAACIFAGMGGVSKSTFSIWLAGRVTRGLVNGDLLGQPSDVLYVSHEDGIEDVVLPRAQANGVDTSKFHIFGVATKTVNGVRMPKFPEDLALLEEKIVEMGVKVVIIDPILSAMPSGRDPNSNVDVRELIDPLNQLAQRLGVTIICIAHINKSVTTARTAVTGSAAWVDATRGTLMFMMDQPDPMQDYRDVVIGGTKQNYGPDGMGHTYRVRGVDHVHDSGEVGSIPKIEWLGKTTRTIEDVLASSNEDRREGFLKGAIKDFIDSTDKATTTAQVLAEFKDQNPTTVRVSLSRLAKAGRITVIAHGVYTSNKAAKA